MPEYFDRYIMQSEDIELMEAFDKSLNQLNSLDISILNAVGDRVYAPGKWTIRDIILHLTDTERIFAYRALRFMRGDSTPLPGFDENAYADNASASRRSLEQLIDELIWVRKSNIALFAPLTDGELLRTGISNGKSISVLAMGFTIISHQIHHFKIISDKYLPLA